MVCCGPKHLCVKIDGTARVLTLIDIIAPSEEDMGVVDGIIFDELVRRELRPNPATRSRN
jgi:hypothetical protein